MIFPTKNVMIRMISQSLTGDGWCRTKLQNFMAAKLKVNIDLRFASGRLISITGHLIGGKNRVNCIATLIFRSGKESFGFKKLLELVWTLLYVFHRSMK